jgi:hypothetical protein
MSVAVGLRVMAEMMEEEPTASDDRCLSRLVFEHPGNSAAPNCPSDLGRLGTGALPKGYADGWIGGPGAAEVVAMANAVRARSRGSER